MNAFENTHKARQNRRLERLYRLSTVGIKPAPFGEREPQPTETMTSQQYQQLQKLQQMAADLLAAIDEAFPEKKGVAKPIAHRELLAILPRSQAVGLSKFRSALRLVAKHGFVEVVEPN